MAIFLVRHGETNGNRDRIVQNADTPLSDLGNQQARQLIRAFSDKPVQRILCSDYLRTQQTAQPLQQQQSCALLLSPLLRERNFGDLRGQHYKDIEADFFAVDYAPPNGETHEVFKQRLDLAWRFVLQQAKQTPGDMVVMTHGLVLRQWVQNRFILPGDVQPLSDFHNTSVTELDDKDQQTIIRLCDIQHLDELSGIGAAV
jgi:broad specificity phosphatase PhoE